MFFGVILLFVKKLQIIYIYNLNLRDIIMDVKIKVENVFKVFGHNPEEAIKLHHEGLNKTEIMSKTKQAVGVADATFDVYDGEKLVVMGLSGSGKSTLVRCINRLIEPTSGKIIIDGQDITGISKEELRSLRRTKFGMVFQRFALFPHKKVWENATYGLELNGVDEKTRREKAYEVLETVGLKGWEEHYPKNLSGGMQQRVGLARALAIEPDILIMDEAFSALDPLIRTEMQDELLSLESKVKKTILFITHDLDEALKVGDRIVLMKDGAIVQIGTPEEILTSPANRYVEKFVENVDFTKVLTAEDVMVKPSVTQLNKGPKVALHFMMENALDGIFVVDQQHKLLGYVTAKRARAAVDEGQDQLHLILEPYDHQFVKHDTAVRDIFEVVVDNKYPVAVVDEDNKLIGKVVESSILAGLAGKKDEE